MLQHGLGTSRSRHCSALPTADAACLKMAHHMSSWLVMSGIQILRLPGRRLQQPVWHTHGMVCLSITGAQRRHPTAIACTVMDVGAEQIGCCSHMPAIRRACHLW